MGAGLVELAIAPSKNFVEQGLPPLRLHDFYNRRVADFADDRPKYSHYWASQLLIGETKRDIGYY